MDASLNADSAGYIVHFVHSWLDFRLPELKAVAEMENVPLRVQPSHEATLSQGVVLPLRSPAEEEGMARLAARAVLVKHILEEWGSGDSWGELASSLTSYPSERAAPFLQAGSTYRIRVQTFGLTCPEQQQLEFIRALAPLLEWRGKVRLKDPEHRFVLVIEPLQPSLDIAVAPRPPPPSHGASGASAAAPATDAAGSSAQGAVVAGEPTVPCRFRFGRER